MCGVVTLPIFFPIVFLSFSLTLPFLLLKFPNTRDVQMLKWRLQRVGQSFLPKESLIWVLVNTGDKWTSVCLLKLHSGFLT